MKNILTFDVEEWFQVANLESAVGFGEWASFPSRLDGPLSFILDLLGEKGVRATFFVLGWIAERHPEFVGMIRGRGHEIGTHGYSHRLIYTQEPGEFDADLKRSLDAIRAAADVEVSGHRAACFSITEGSRWALEILLDNGILYDSSIFPVRHHRYGIQDSPRRPYIALQKGGLTLLEFPLSTVRLGSMNIPVAGGGYFRLYPYFLTRAAIRSMNKSGSPAVVYLHPWEFDPEIPRVKGIGAVNSFRHYVNIGRNRRRLRRLLDDFEFETMGEARENYTEALRKSQRD